MPAYELIKEEQAAAKNAAKALGKKVNVELSVPSIPHMLPFTRWSALTSAESVPHAVHYAHADLLLLIMVLHHTMSFAGAPLQSSGGVGRTQASALKRCL